MSEGIIEQLEEDFEELFPPKPGGMVDKHRRRKAAEEAAKTEGATSEVVELGRNKVKAVRTVVEAADIASAQTVLLSATSPVRRLLPRDEHRRSAVVMAVDNDVYITSDEGMAWNVQGAATNAGGFYLPKLTQLKVDSTAVLYVAATTTGTTTRVSVLISRESAA